MIDLEELRKNVNLTQIDFCKILGIAQGHYKRLINNLKQGKDLNSSIALNISKHFNISLDYIYSNYITVEDREQGVVDFTQIVVNAGEYDVVSIYRAIGEKLGEGGQEAYRELGQSILDNLNNNLQLYLVITMGIL